MKKTFLGILLLLGGANQSPGAVLVNVWQGPAAGEVWSNSNNWSLDVVPNNNVTDQYIAEITSGATVNFTTDNTVDGLNISSGNVLNIGNFRNLTVDEGAFTGNGTVNLNATNGTTQIQLIGNAPTAFSGGGVVQMSDHFANRISGTNNANGIVNNDWTFQGSGSIVANVGSFVNHGAVIANQSTPLIIDPSALGMTNDGVLGATSGGTLRITNGAVDNTSGDITADPGSTVEINFSQVSNGNVSLNGASFLSLNNTTLTDVTTSNSATGQISIFSTSAIVGGSINNPLGGVIDITNGSVLAVDNATTFSNAGSLNLNASSLTTTLRAEGSALVDIDGGGTISLSDHASNIITANNAASGFNNLNNFIHGSGMIVNNIGGFQNQAAGVVQADQPTPLRIDPATGIPVVNLGLFKATNGATLDLLIGDFTNTGGQITIDPLATLITNGSDITGGNLSLGNMSTWNSLAGASFTNMIVAQSSTSNFNVNGQTSFIGGTLTNPAGGQINIANGQILEIDGTTTFLNGGEINLNASSLSTTFRATGSTPLTLSGGGRIDLSDHPSNFLTATTTSGIINVDHIIRGSGTIVNNSGSFVNQATVSADQTNKLIIDPATGIPVVNTGVFEAVNFATLRLINGDFTNTGGFIDIDDGAKLETISVNITGGNLTLGNASTWELNNSTFTNMQVDNFANGVFNVISNTNSFIGGTVNNPGTVNIFNGALLQVDASTTFNNSGVVNLGASSLTTTFRATGSGNTVLDGGGVFNLSDHGGNIITSNAATGIINQNNTIRGSGILINNSGVFENHALISADQPTELIIDPATGFPMVNTGTMEAVNGATLHLRNGDFNNTGGLVDIEDGATLTMTSANLSDGVVQLGFNSPLNLTNSTLSNVTFSNQSGSQINVSGLSALGGNITNDPGATILIPNGAQLDFLGGASVLNDGQIQLQGSIFTTTLRVTGGAVSLLGTGFIETTDDPQNRMIGAAGSDMLINESGHSIFFSGALGGNFMLLNNRGVIENFGSTPLIIDTTNSLNSFNSGDIRAGGGGTVTLSGTQLVNTESSFDGLLEAQAGSRLGIQNSSVTGGFFEVQDTGIGELTNSILDGVQFTNFNGGLMEVNAGTTLLTNSTLDNQSGATLSINNGAFLGLGVGNTINNAGVIKLNGNVSTTRLRIDAGNVDLMGGGSLELINDPQNGVSALANSNRLTNMDNHIFGGGSINDNLLALTNRSLIEATGTFDINLTDIADNFNTGQFLASPGGVFNISGTKFKQDELLGPIGTFRTTGGVFNLTNVTIDNGFLDSSSGGAFNIISSNNELIDVISTADIFVNNGGTLRIHTSFGNQAQITTQGTTGTTTISFGGPTGVTLLDGGGTIFMFDDPQNRIIATNIGDQLQNVDNIINGSGFFGADTLAIHNQAGGVIRSEGAVEFDINAHDTLGLVNDGLIISDGGNLSLNDSPTNNALGQIIATNGGLLTIKGASVVTGGVVDINSGGTLILSSGTIQNGATTIDATSQAHVQSAPNRLSGTVNNFGVFALDNGATLTLDQNGVYNNVGDIEINGTTATTSLTIDSQVTMLGGGEVVLNGDPQSRILGQTSASLLINQNNTIRGGGFVGSNFMGLNNHGLIVADLNGVVLNIDPTDSVPIVNTGSIGAQNNGILQISGNIDQTGGGLLFSDPGSLFSFNGITTVTGGQVGGFGSTSINSFVTFDGVTSVGDIDIANGANLTLQNTFTNQALLRNNGTTATTDIDIEGVVTLTGGGGIQLGNDPQARITGVNATTAHLINEDNTLNGGGMYGANLLRITNRGSIQVDGDSNMNWSNTAASLNPGQIEVANGVTLDIVDSHIINREGATTGFISVNDNGVINTSSNTILEDGDLFSFDSDFNPNTDGVFRATGNTTLRNINLYTRFEAANGSILTLEGTVQNNREIAVLGNTATTSLTVGVGGATLEGFGLLTLNDDPQSTVTATNIGDQLINNGNQIQGGGQLGAGRVNFKNLGSIEATGTTALTVNTSEPTFVNEGQLRSSGAGGFIFSEALENQGGFVEILSGSLADVTGSYTQTSGGSTLVDGILDAMGGVFNQSGFLGGSGQIIGNVTNDAFISPGSSPGQLDISGNLTLSSTSAMFIEIGGVTAGVDFDVLHVTGTAILSGDFHFDIINGFTPSFSDALIVLNSSSLSGAFNQIDGDTIFTSGWSATIHYGPASSFNANQVVLTDFTPVPEPETYALFALGGGMVGLWFWRRRKTNATHTADPIK